MSTGVETTTVEVAAGPASRRGMKPILVMLFMATTLAGASLLFAVEPMVAKMLLPPYGGSPMVWNTAVLFFQAALLGGYAYAHWSARRLRLRRQPLVQIALAAVPVVLLPVALPAWAEAPASVPTVLWLLVVLAVMVGAPFTVLATTGPMVQRWYSWSGLPRAHDPYFLYAAGNVGSLLALLGYPFVIEPLADLSTQAYWWAAGYWVFAVLMICGAVAVRIAGRDRAPAVNVEPEGREPEGREPEAPPIGWGRRARWMVLAFIPSSLMLGVTTHITTDIAPVPLMWVVPLAIYLLTFIIAFGTKRQTWLTGLVPISALFAFVLPWVVAWFGHTSFLVMIPLDLLLVAVAGLACHGLIAADRPEVQKLTEFYLFVSLGGALGGVFNGLLAPVIFDWVAELPLVIAMLALVPLMWAKISGRSMAPGARTGVPIGSILFGLFLGLFAYLATDIWWMTALALGPLVIWWFARNREQRFAFMAALILVPLFVISATSADVRERTFFGTYRVVVAEGSRMLTHGTTMHGYQRLDAAEEMLPVSYYSRPGPIGDVFGAYGDLVAQGRIGIAGLGVGGLAAYGQPGQRMDFYEIDPVVVRLARNHFTYLRKCRCEERTIVGDARLRIERVPDRTYEMIILDAFASDAVPVHLLTQEALELYVRKLKPGGILLFNVTNRHLDLGPMLGATAKEAGLTALQADDLRRQTPTATPSRWVAVGRSDADLAPLRNRNARWRRIPAGGPVWTDTYSSLFGVLST